MNSKGQMAHIGGLEAGTFVFALAMASEALLRLIPGIETFDVGLVAAIRLVVYAMACVACGFWMQRRYDLSVNVAAMAFATGLLASFVVKAFRGDEQPLSGESYGFLLVLGVANWVVLMLGAVIARHALPLLRPRR